METVDRLDVFFGEARVGTIAPYQKYMTAFEYSPEWIREGFSISPFSLPLEPGVRIAQVDPFDGLFGVFADSLPDGWGRLLVDRMLRREGEDPEAIDALTRLSIVGDSGMGALEYRPAHKWHSPRAQKDFDHLAEECGRILHSEEPEDLDMLFSLGGSSGGARPKVMVELNGEEWIVKFPSHVDPDNIGRMEYEYHCCAKECGIDVPDVRLFPSKRCEGYFGSKRFDRVTSSGGIEKRHMISASALLEVSHRVPSLDYTALMALTWQLTKQACELERMYRLMCFNVFSHNRDDHSNNFSFIYDSKGWSLSPAYDLTWSNSIGGEHATTIAGEGRDPGMDDLLAVAKKAGIRERTAKEIAGEIRDIVDERLNSYRKERKK